MGEGGWENGKRGKINNEFKLMRETRHDWRPESYHNLSNASTLITTSWAISQPVQSMRTSPFPQMIPHWPKWMKTQMPHSQNKSLQAGWEWWWLNRFLSTASSKHLLWPQANFYAWWLSKENIMVQRDSQSTQSANNSTVKIVILDWEKSSWYPSY